MLKKEQSALRSVKNALEGENMQIQYSVLTNRTDLYFHKYKLAVEVDELGHCDRNTNYEIGRQEAIKEKLGCVFIRINPNEENFNIFNAIIKIHRYIKKLPKESLIDKV